MKNTCYLLVKGDLEITHRAIGIKNVEFRV